MRAARLAVAVGALAVLSGVVTACNNTDPRTSDPSPSACPAGKASWTGPRLDGKPVLVCDTGDEGDFVGGVPADVAAIDAAVPKGCAAIRTQYDKLIAIGGADSPYGASKLSAYAEHAKQALADGGCPVPS